MSSIDARNDARAARFYDEVMAPLGATLRQQGIALADVALARTDASTYYTPVASFSKNDFEAAIGAEGEALVAALVAVWAGRPFLHALARQLAALAADFEPPPPQEPDLSPFVYVMF
jgi:hypothetical protein